MKRLWIAVVIFGLVGCHKKKTCAINPLNYIYKPPKEGSTYFTSDWRGRAEVKIYENGCFHYMVFIKGNWCEKRDENDFIFITSTGCVKVKGCSE